MPSCVSLCDLEDDSAKNAGVGLPRVMRALSCLRSRSDLIRPLVHGESGGQGTLYPNGVVWTPVPIMSGSPALSNQAGCGEGATARRAAQVALGLLCRVDLGHELVDDGIELGRRDIPGLHLQLRPDGVAEQLRGDPVAPSDLRERSPG